MVNRIVLDSNYTLRVSDPGVDVFSTVPQTSLLNSNYPSVGSYTTGQVNPAAQNPSSWSSGFTNGPTYYRYKLFLPNPTNAIPTVMLQQDGRANFTYYNYDHYRETVDEAYNTTSSSLGGAAYIGFMNYGVNASSVDIFSNSLSTVRYHVFFHKSGENVYAAQDVTPDYMYGGLPTVVTPNQTAITPSSGQGFTISGLDAGVSIVLRFYSTLAGATSPYRVAVNRFKGQGINDPAGYGTFYFAPGSNNLFIEVTNGDMISMFLTSTDYLSVDRALQCGVYNTSAAPEVEVANFYLRTGYRVTSPDYRDWSNVGGTAKGYTNTQPITGINVPISLGLSFDPPFTGRVGVNVADANLSLSNASNRDNMWTGQSGDVFFVFEPTVNYNGTVCVRNNTRNEAIDCFNVNMAAAAERVVMSLPDISGFRNNTGTGSVSLTSAGAAVTVSGVTSEHTIQANGDISGASVTMFRNRGGSVTSINLASNRNMNVINGDQINFQSTIGPARDANFSTIITVSDISVGGVVSSFAINQTINGNL